MASPRVSVVTATYNRSNVLRLTIEAMRASTFEDWELIVVGDACTDDTAAVVASFADSRMRFINRTENSGEQAVPNNEGVRAARGEFIAFLNHDDLWTRDHLQTAVAGIGDADFVSTLTIAVDARDQPLLLGACPRGEYEPRVTIPASSWLVRRDLFDRIGLWRPAREIHNAPSQEWLHRASRQGHRLISIEKVTVIALFSGGRTRSYAERHVDENSRYAALLRDDPNTVERLLTRIAARYSNERHAPAQIASRLVKAAFERVCIVAGAHPLAVRNALRFGRRGGFVNALRRVRGLPPLR